MEPNFNLISPNLRSNAEEHWENKEPDALFGLVGHQHRGQLLLDNLEQLIRRGMYEGALHETYIHGPHLKPHVWRYLFEKADRTKLAALGEPIPNEPIKVYRGISDAMHLKWIRGLSWTLNPNIAAWFATRNSRRGNPAVFSLLVEPASILMISNERQEEEVILATWKCGIARRVIPIPEALTHWNTAPEIATLLSAAP